MAIVKLSALGEALLPGVKAAINAHTEWWKSSSERDRHEKWLDGISQYFRWSETDRLAGRREFWRGMAFDLIAAGPLPSYDEGYAQIGLNADDEDAR